MPIDPETGVTMLVDPYKALPIVEPATVLVAEAGHKLTVIDHAYLRGGPKAEQVVYVEVME